MNRYESWPCVLLTLVLLQACGGTTIEQQIKPVLACQDLTLYPQSGLRQKLYTVTAPPTEEQTEWRLSQGSFVYEKTVNPGCYLYALVYYTPESKKKDDDNRPVMYIQHLVLTKKTYPKTQNIFLRYLTQEPLLFEWTDKLLPCP